MAKKRTKIRVSSKFDDLPDDIILQVDSMLSKNSNTYIDISEFLKSEGYEISKSSVGRYALRTNSAVQRILEAQVQTEKLVQAIQKNPEKDYTDAAMILLMDGLTKKMATAEEEFDLMPLDKAGRLVASISRTKVYKDRVKQDMQKKADIAFREMEESIMKVIKQDGRSADELKHILQKAKESMIEND